MGMYVYIYMVFNRNTIGYILVMTSNIGYFAMVFHRMEYHII